MPKALAKRGKSGRHERLRDIALVGKELLQLSDHDRKPLLMMAI